MSRPDRSKLPIRQGPFQGVAKRTLEGPQPDWDAIGQQARSFIERVADRTVSRSPVWARP